MAKEPFRELDIEGVTPAARAPAVMAPVERAAEGREGLFISGMDIMNSGFSVWGLDFVFRALGLVVERDFQMDGIRVRRRRPGEPGVEPGVEPGGDRQR